MPDAQDCAGHAVYAVAKETSRLCAPVVEDAEVAGPGGPAECH